MTTKTAEKPLCPQCGASRTELEKSLNEGVTSENFWIAEKIIGNCKLCSVRFNGLLKKMGG